MDLALRQWIVNPRLRMMISCSSYHPISWVILWKKKHGVSSGLSLVNLTSRQGTLKCCSRNLGIEHRRCLLEPRLVRDVRYGRQGNATDHGSRHAQDRALRSHRLLSRERKRTCYPSSCV